MNELKIEFKYIDADIHDPNSNDEIEIGNLFIDGYKFKINPKAEQDLKCWLFYIHRNNSLTT